MRGPTPEAGRPAAWSGLSDSPLFFLAEFSRLRVLTDVKLDSTPAPESLRRLGCRRCSTRRPEADGLRSRGGTGRVATSTCLGCRGETGPRSSSSPARGQWDGGSQCSCGRRSEDVAGFKGRSRGLPS